MYNEEYFTVYLKTVLSDDREIEIYHKLDKALNCNIGITDNGFIIYALKSARRVKKILDVLNKAEILLERITEVKE